MQGICTARILRYLGADAGAGSAACSSTDTAAAGARLLNNWGGAAVELRGGSRNVKVTTRKAAVINSTIHWAEPLTL